MKFIIQYKGEIAGSGHKPVEGATFQQHKYHEIRNTNDPSKDKYYKQFGSEAKQVADKEWYGRGMDHREIDGKIARSFFCSSWFVDVPSVQMLVDMIQTYGNFLISYPECYDYPLILIEK